jgi:alkyl hydroperoxide reductase subunit AhpC
MLVDVQVVGCSVDSHFTHLVSVRTLHTLALARWAEALLAVPQNLMQLKFAVEDVETFPAFSTGIF